MRILANYVLKQGKENYGSEQYMVTVEAESEFNNIAQVADYLFHQARSAVDRQISGKASSEAPKTVTPPAAEGANREKDAAPDQQTEEKPSNVKGNPLPATDKQSQMIAKLIGEQFRTRSEGLLWLKARVGVERLETLGRKQASKAIEALLDKQRKIA